MSHIVLLGDSIFDNGAYTSGGPDVVTQLRRMLPGGWAATLRALDGARTSDVVRQVASLPPDTSHLVLSVGGNDALSHGDLLDQRGVSAAEVFERLADAAGEFESRYRRLVDQLLVRRLPLVVCTIYNGSFPDPTFQRIASTALCPFNDAILRVAFRRGLTIIDLRPICCDPADYANPIEPSSMGGAKIALAIAQSVGAAPALARGPSIIDTVPDLRTQFL
ncbi:MAG TPA: SGNH/GDSL hydrolase family protein [Gemmatimonadales bacterium]|nr:SGNH/GDSL hydrolase family protein [Gemmatimonadales bacterium]